MRRSTHFFVILLLFWTSSCCKLNRDSDWEKVYEELHERVTGDFVFKQL
uniref:Lipoprotein n=1 Tax=Mesocestoides corti TaxID=53468 RepID=A0A5K3FWB4_MESCO